MLGTWVGKCVYGCYFLAKFMRLLFGYHNFNYYFVYFAMLILYEYSLYFHDYHEH